MAKVRQTLESDRKVGELLEMVRDYVVASLPVANDDEDGSHSMVNQLEMQRLEEQIPAAFADAVESLLKDG